MRTLRITAGPRPGFIYEPGWSAALLVNFSTFNRTGIFGANFNPFSHPTWVYTCPLGTQTLLTACLDKASTFVRQFLMRNS